ncbi:MAG: GIY-YIG nuclease family protein [Candidatus Thiodiazotropha sp. (ex Monitilora ramsayi)]|nr:GIY-YIG nuclease family protein [Candidatus Thiodiazotropha sp. (ex Monitilora ramsayi)]
MDIPVGKLGNFTFARGWYLYVGSAFGPGGVAARCRHHRQVSTHPRWHIDYLRAVCDLREVWFTHDPVPREHLWAKRLASKLKLQSPVHGFGASDCGCGSHLFFSAVKPNGKRFLALASRKYPAELPVYCEFV